MTNPGDSLAPVPEPSTRADPAWPVQRGQLDAMIADFPWEQTPLGRITTWPAHLRYSVNVMLRSSAPMAIIWGKSYHFLYNDQYAEIIQDKHPSALGASAPEIFPEIWHILAPLFAKVIGGEAVLIEDQELAIYRGGTLKSGYFSFSYTPVASDCGVIDGFLAMVVETTARVVLEQGRAHVFDTVLSAITDFAYTFDRDGRFLYVNKALLDLWGLKLADAVGKNFFELKYPDELAGHLQRQIQQVITEKSTVRDETRYVSPAGVEGYYEYIFSPVFGPDGTVTVVAGSTRDITSRKKLEMAALAAAKAKDDFLATLSHELRTPLNPVLLIATDAAANPDLSPKVRADFQSIADHVALEARLIDDLLDISRIIHDKLPLTLQPLDLHPLLLRALAAVEGELTEKKQTLVPQLAAPATIVQGDEARLHQVFGNLLRNAVKFTPAGGRITLQTRAHATRPDTVVVEISDTGLGLTPAELAKVFQPFAQGEHTREEAGRFGGLGLGLTISRQITELHHGAIFAESAGRNQGSRFTVELPATAGGLEAPGSRKVTPRSASAGIRVLLVEDHTPSRQILARFLTTRQIECAQAATAAEALEKAQAQAFDLVISDLGLPDQSGYDLMAALKATYGLTGIALSGYGMEEDIAHGKAVGFRMHLIKPVQAQALDEALAQFAPR